jgi:uncharacterized protein DUF4440
LAPSVVTGNKRLRVCFLESGRRTAQEATDEASSVGNISEYVDVPNGGSDVGHRGGNSLENRLGTWLVIVCLIAPSIRAFAQSTLAQSTTPASMAAASDELFQTISRLDKQVFDAIDRCDMKTESSFWADDAEFYHDKNGLMVGGPQIVDAIKNNLCGKVIRELVPGTLEVYPVAGYGAVEIGVHRFLHPWEQDHGIVGEAKFIHVWRYKDGMWKITRVISIDHHEAK